MVSSSLQLIRKIVLLSVAKYSIHPFQTWSISWRPCLLIPSICFLLSHPPSPPSPPGSRGHCSQPPPSGTSPIGCGGCHACQMVARPAMLARKAQTRQGSKARQDKVWMLGNQAWPGYWLLQSLGKAFIFCHILLWCNVINEDFGTLIYTWKVAQLRNLGSEY